MALLIKPARTALMTLGTVAGVAALVTASGFGTSAKAEVQARFLSLQSTEVVVTDTQPEPGELAYPLAALANLSGLTGVKADGLLFAVNTSARGGVRHNVESPESSVSVVGGTGGVLPASGARLAWGVGLEQWMVRDRADTVVLGEAAARQLHVSAVGGPSAVLIDGVPFSVVGVIASVGAESELLGDAIVPASTALKLWGTPNGGSETVIETARGASESVAAQAPAALLPTDPGRLAAVGATGAFQIATSVNDEVGQLVGVVAIVTLVIGSIGIAVAMILTIVERSYEIGLRRALGATRGEIMVQFLLEAVAVGSLGGGFGTAVGAVALVVITSAHHWQPVVDPAIFLIAPAVGAVAGLVAGLYPAARAANLYPVDALRR